MEPTIRTVRSIRHDYIGLEKLRQAVQADAAALSTPKSPRWPGAMKVSWQGRQSAEECHPAGLVGAQCC